MSQTLRLNNDGKAGQMHLIMTTTTVVPESIIKVVCLSWDSLCFYMKNYIDTSDKIDFSLFFCVWNLTLSPGVDNIRCEETFTYEELIL